MQAGPQATVPHPAAHELLYVVDVEATKRGELTLLVMERPRRKDGTSGKEKPTRVPIAELPLLSDDHDREILPLLQTAGELGGSYTYYGYSAAAFPARFAFRRAWPPC